MDSILDDGSGESLLQLEIKKCQQAFAMSTNDEPEEFEEIEFYHPRYTTSSNTSAAGDLISSNNANLNLKFQIGINKHNIVNGTAHENMEQMHHEDSSESPYIFPSENVLEYGEPQFFPGNCVGYLETILEETDEDYEEEETESSSGRHCWWTADSDTDTDSVIRLQPAPENNNTSATSSVAEALYNDFLKLEAQAQAAEIAEAQSTPSSFLTTASSKPFEMEDLFLLDQLDIAFEENFSKTSGSEKLEQEINKSSQLVPKSQNSIEDDDEQPHEVNEEDFFYSTSEESDSGDSSSSSESGSSDQSGPISTSSSSSATETDTKVLAEFSLATADRPSNRRSFDLQSSSADAKIRSFRSFDSLNSLSGTELLFSKDTFPSFDFIKEEAASKSPSPERKNEIEPNSACTPEVQSLSRKNSGEASSDNLSEDSGISGSVPKELDMLLIGRPEFALNPFLYSSPSASEDNSMNSCSNTQASVIPIESTTEGPSSLELSEEIVASKVVDQFLHSVTMSSWISLPLPIDENDVLSVIETKSKYEEEQCYKNEYTSSILPMSTLDYMHKNSLASHSHTTTNINSPTNISIIEEDNDNCTMTTTTPSNPAIPALLNIHNNQNSYEDTRIEKENELLESFETKSTGHVDHTLSSSSSLTVSVQEFVGIPILSSSNFGFCTENTVPQSPTTSTSPINPKEKNPKSEFEQSFKNGESVGESKPNDPVSVQNLTLTSSEENVVLVPDILNISPTAITSTINISPSVNNNSSDMEFAQDSRNRNSPIVPILKTFDDEQAHSHFFEEGSGGEDQQQHHPSSSLKTKSVHFSPVVSEISWRESYTSSSGETEDPALSQDLLGDDGSNSINTLVGLEFDELDNNFAPPSPSPPPLKVQVHTETITEPSRPELFLPQIQNILDSDTVPNEPPTKLSPIVPDLVTSHYIHPPPVHIQEVLNHMSDPPPLLEPPPMAPQHQIFPAKFSAEGANGKSIPIGGKAKKSKKEKENVEKHEKPSFFQRLSKIRLSGSKNKQKKSSVVQIHPKPEATEQPHIAKPVSIIKGPILKNTNSNGYGISTSPAAPSPESARVSKDHDEVSEAFENILEEIAGLNTILQRQSLPPSSNNVTPRSSTTKLRSFAERKQFLSNPEIEKSFTPTNLESKLSQFKEEASKTRDQISKSHPDLETIEDVTRHSTLTKTPTPPPTQDIVDHAIQLPTPVEKKTEREWYKLLKSAAEKYYHGNSNGKSVNGVNGAVKEKHNGGKHSISSTETDESEDEGRKSGPSPKISHSTGIVETDLDTGTSREMLDAELIRLDYETSRLSSYYPQSSPKPSHGSPNGKARSLTNLTSGLKLSIAPESDLLLQLDGNGESGNESDERAKSLEFLLDDDRKRTSASVPPENNLQARQLSEHELRIQKSLQKINVPEWYKKRSTSAERSVPAYTPGTTAALKLLKRSEYGSAGGLAGGWAGLSTFRTPSMSSLTNSSTTGKYTGSLNRSNFVRGKPGTMSLARSSRESLLSPSSTASQSPSAFERCSFTYGMPLSLTRFNQSRLSSTSSTGSPPNGPNPTLSSTVRKPYLGWRSQEKLLTESGGPNSSTTSTAPKLSIYRPPAERLAAEVLSTKAKSRPPNLPKPPPRSEKTVLSSTTKTISSPPILPISSESDQQSIHRSIREVTDAINQFVNLEVESSPQPPKIMPRAKKQSFWFESSFVGRKPVGSTSTS